MQQPRSAELVKTNNQWSGTLGKLPAGTERIDAGGRALLLPNDDGSDVMLSLVDREMNPRTPSVETLSLSLTCTNRDLPLFIPTGQTQGELTLNITAPIQSIHIVSGPSR